LSEQVAEAVRDTVGADSPAGRAVIDSYAQKLPADPQGGADERR
jgi:hypothetical protein